MNTSHVYVPEARGPNFGKPAVNVYWKYPVTSRIT